jgi:uncharacterized membrane protein
VLRRELARLEAGRDHRFRWRGGDVSRVEAISDAVFGFALTLIVVSLEAPKTLEDLKAEMLSVPIFACSFAILLLIWFKQYRFFRRFGLEDVTTTVLNFALLFTVLVYVYPLKFLFTGLFHGSAQHLNHVEYAQLLVIYSAGYIAYNVIFVWLYRHALTFARDLELSTSETYEVTTEIGTFVVSCIIGAAVPAIAFAMPAPLDIWTGLLYLTVTPAIFAWEAYRRRCAPVPAA